MIASTKIPHLGLVSLLLLVISCFPLAYGQETLPTKKQLLRQARRYVKTLTSPKMFGRGYVKGGDSLAATWLTKKFRALVPSANVKQEVFSFQVNTFPLAPSLVWGNQKLVVGRDWLPSPGMPQVKGKFFTIRPDSTTVFSMQDTSAALEQTAWIIPQKWKRQFHKIKRKKQPRLLIWLVPDKFTWSVATEQDSTLELDLLVSSMPTHADTIELEAKPLLKAHRTRNVICTVRSLNNRPPARIRYLTAHYDHLGGIGKSLYFPGANDNASGIAMLLTLAACQTLDSSTEYRFVAFAAEEAGLLGSRYHVEQLLKNKPDVPVEVLNLDLMSAGEGGITVVNATTFPDLYNRLEGYAKQLGLELKRRGKAANSDHYWFGEAGIPSVFCYAMGGTTHYHDPEDKLEYCTFGKFYEMAQLFANFAGLRLR